MSRRGPGEGSIRHRKNGRWEARLRYIDPLTGFAERLHLSAPTRPEVVAQLDDARRRLRAGKIPRDRGTVLGPFLTMWLEDVVKPTKRDWTYRSYKNVVDNHLVPSRLGTMAMRDIREVHVQRELIAKAPGTRTQQLSIVVLRLALEQARKWSIVETNVAAGITTPRAPRRELRVLSADEARRFLAAASGDRLQPLYYLALDSGMRQGELFALQWRDVDFEAGTVSVVRSLSGSLKTKASRRRIALGMAAISCLRAHKARLAAEGYHGPLVFPSTGGALLSPSNVRVRSFLPLQRAASIDPPIRFHDLRHTAATLMLEAGVHPKVVSERLGHATIAITMDTYQHVTPTLQREVAEIMGRVLSQDAAVPGAEGVKRGRQTSPGAKRRKRKKRARSLS